MADDNSVRVQFRCSRCGHVVATAPKDHALKKDLVCSGCGATVKQPGILEKMAAEVRGMIEMMKGRRGDDSM